MSVKIELKNGLLGLDLFMKAQIVLDIAELNMYIKR